MPRKIPQRGVHEGVKYSPKRSILKTCPECGKLFLQYSRGFKKYCNSVCASNAKRKQMKVINQMINKKRDPFEHANDMRQRYANRKLSKKTWTIGTYTPPALTLDDNGNPDYDEYHRRLELEKRKIGIS